MPPAECLPIWRQPNDRPVFLIAHLFSGRRRQTYKFTGTAKSPSFGNLQVSSVTWGKLLQLYRDGRTIATLTGAPCETWSAARHPAPHANDKIVSVWTAPWTVFLRQHPDIHLHIVGQWKWGCAVGKPTGLLALRLPYFIQSMHSRALPDAKPPDSVAVGGGDDGQFRTSAYKEYPIPFCSALAGNLIDEIRRRQVSNSCAFQNPPDPDLVNWVHEAEVLCGQIRQGATWLPDFQDR